MRAFSRHSSVFLRGRGCRGFTLLEVLVALLVLAVGVLGISAMQLKTMQSSHVSYQRTIATLAAKDAVERLWISLGNSGGVCPSGEAGTLLVDVDGVPGVEDWVGVWGGYLPGLEAGVVTSPAACEYVVVVQWDDERLEGNATSLGYFVKLPGRE